MHDLASYLLMLIIKSKICFDTEPEIRLYINIGIVLCCFLPIVVPSTNLAHCIFRRLTTKSNLPLKNAIIAIKLAFAATIFSQEQGRNQTLVNPFLACPLDLADFALALALYMIATDGALVFLALLFWSTGFNDEIGVFSAFVVLVGLCTTALSG